MPSLLAKQGHVCQRDIVCRILGWENSCLFDHDSLAAGSLSPLARGRASILNIAGRKWHTCISTRQDNAEPAGLYPCRCEPMQTCPVLLSPFEGSLANHGRAMPPDMCVPSSVLTNSGPRDSYRQVIAPADVPGLDSWQSWWARATRWLRQAD